MTPICFYVWPEATTPNRYCYGLGTRSRYRHIHGDTVISLAVRHGIDLADAHQRAEQSRRESAGPHIIEITSEPPDELREPVEELDNHLRNL